jgi:hypothetical protein
MPVSLSEFAKSHPSRKDCNFCSLLSPKLVAEINAGIAADMGTDVIRRWLKVAHGIEISTSQVSNHKRGLASSPERHQGKK